MLHGVLVAGLVSMMPEDWVCALLGVDPDDVNHDMQSFFPIAATHMQHNAIVKTLATKTESSNPCC
ncbi:MAG: hypothetical protein ABSG83_16465 [Roseiarcus sp.]